MVAVIVSKGIAQMPIADTTAVVNKTPSVNQVPSERWYIGFGATGKDISLFMTFLKKDITPNELKFYWGLQLSLGLDGSYPVYTEYAGYPFSWWEPKDYYMGSGYFVVPLMLQSGNISFGLLGGVAIRMRGTFYWSTATYQYFHDPDTDVKRTYYPEYGARFGLDIGKYHIALQGTNQRYFGAEFMFGF